MYNKTADSTKVISGVSISHNNIFDHFFILYKISLYKDTHFPIVCYLFLIFFTYF